MHNYKKLTVWQEAINLVEKIYLVTENFPPKERYGLTQQILRASVSIPSNIAEGAGRNSDKDFTHFLSFSLGSAYELGTQLIIANRIKYLDEIKLNELENELEIIQKQLYRLQESLKKND